MSEDRRARLAQALRPKAESLKATPLDPERDYPLSYAQSRMWFLEQLEPGNSAYHETSAVRLFHCQGPEALNRALSALVVRHECLRTTFHARQGTPVQRVGSPWGVMVAEIRAMEEDLPEQARRFAELPFDLREGPLLRAGLFYFAEGNPVLLLVLHHIVVDGWSGGLLMAELMDLLAGRDLGAAPLPYREYAAWQIRQPLGEAGLYWKSRLEGLTRLALPISPDPIAALPGEAQGARLRFLLEPRLVASLEALGRKCEATLFMVLLSGWAAVLRRWTGCSDVPVAIPMAQRPRVELERVVGLFLNTLIARVDVAGNPRWRELVERTRTSLLADYAHQECSFESVVGGLREARQDQDVPLLSVMMVLQPSRPPLAGAEEIELHNGGSKLDLTLGLDRLPDGGMRAFLEYPRSLFSAAVMQRLQAHLLQVLEEMARRPETRLLELPADEKARLHILGDGQERTLLPESIVEIFSRQALAWPAAPALLQEGEKLSYGELDRKSNDLAKALVDRGVEPGDRIGLFLPCCFERLVGLLATLKAGASFVPLDPADPPRWTARLLRDAEPRLVLCLDERSDWSSLDVRQSAGQSDSTLVGRARPDLPLALLYTSGSTGDPRGVIVSQSGTLNRFAWMWRDFPFEVGEVLCHKGAFGFVDSLWEMLGGLLQGIPTLLVSPEKALRPQELTRAVQEHGVSRLVMTPSLLRLWLTDVDMNLKGLRLLVCSGESLPADLARKVLRRFPQVRLLNLYGSTEVSGDVTWSDVPVETERVSLGKPLDNCRIELRDADGGLVPWGATGEIYVAGANLAQGYWRNADLTAERFPTLEGVRYYRTGDAGRWDESGQLCYSGRLDRMVTLRGLRIEPQAIEACLLEHPDVQEALVRVQDEQLVAFVGSPRALSGDEMRGHLRRRLPRTQVPHRFEFLPELPRGSRGKIDAGALVLAKSVAITGLAANNDVEARLLPIWRRHLGANRLGVTDNFFEHGGHSLLAVGLLEECQRELACSLSLAALFEAPTVQALARAIGLGDQARSSPLVRIKQGIGSPLFLVHPAGGGLAVYSDLVGCMSSEQAVEGFQSLDQPNEPTSLEVLASRYVDALLLAHPQGPYVLLGLSLGGTLAFQMACLLEARSMAATLILVDSYAPGYWRPESWRWLSFLHLQGQRIKLNMGHFVNRVPVRGWPAFVRRRLSEKARTSSHLPRSPGLNLLHSLAAYRPQANQSFRGNCLIVRAAYQPLHLNGCPALGWLPFLEKSPALDWIPGIHGGVLVQNPIAPILVRKLLLYLRQREGRSGATRPQL